MAGSDSGMIEIIVNHNDDEVWIQPVEGKKEVFNMRKMRDLEKVLAALIHHLTEDETSSIKMERIDEDEQTSIDEWGR